MNVPSNQGKKNEPFSCGFSLEKPGESQQKKKSDFMSDGDLGGLSELMQKSCNVCAKEIAKGMKTNKPCNEENMRDYYLKVIESDDAEPLLRGLARQTQIEFLGMGIDEYMGGKLEDYSLRCDIVGDGDNGDFWTEVVEFKGPDDCISFGRMSWCEVNLNAESFGSYVSRLHFVLMRHPEGILAVDLGSLRGLWVFETEDEDPGLDYSFSPEARQPIVFPIPQGDDELFIRAGDARIRLSRYA